MVFMPVGFGPAELFVDLRGVEGVRLPHFELVDGVGGNVVAAESQRCFPVPGVGHVGWPLLRFGHGNRRQQREHHARSQIPLKLSHATSLHACKEISASRDY